MMPPSDSETEESEDDAPVKKGQVCTWKTFRGGGEFAQLTIGTGELEFLMLPWLWLTARRLRLPLNDHIKILQQE